MDPSMFSKIAQQMGISMDKDSYGQASNIWKMLDEMVENNPDEYKKFVEGHIKGGVEDLKKENKKKVE